MKERILEIMRHFGISQAQLAEQIDVPPSLVSHIVHGRNRPSLDVAVKILAIYKEVSPDWLLLGDGAMLRAHGGRRKAESPPPPPPQPKKVHHITIYYADGTYSNYYPDSSIEK